MSVDVDVDIDRGDRGALGAERADALSEVIAPPKPQERALGKPPVRLPQIPRAGPESDVLAVPEEVAESDALPSVDLLARALEPFGRRPVVAKRAEVVAKRAEALLERFRTLRRLAAATPAELVARGGLEPKEARRLTAVFALGRRAAQERVALGAPFRSSLDIFDRFHPLLRDVKKERFLCVLLDARNRVLREERVSEGSLTSSLVHPREAFGAAVRESAGGVVFVHNHPSGDPEPSSEDVEITRRLVAVGELLGIRVQDHVVIGDATYVSFLDRGLL